MQVHIYHPSVLRSASAQLRRSGVLAALTLAGCSSASHPEGQMEGPKECPSGFATSVVSVEFGTGAGAGQDRMPDIVLGPPQGAGSERGSTDVLTLGVGGQLVLGAGEGGITDGPGPDFIVFENVFYIGGDSSKAYVEPAEVGVSEDGTNWTTFPCLPEDRSPQACAGLRPVFASSDNQISPFDPVAAGGDSFDLAQIGIAHARYIRIADRSPGSSITANGFDLDAIAIIHTHCP